MMPWKLVADPDGYIFTWLIGYSALLGPIGGIMIADYFVCRQRKLNVAALYSTDGEYRYTSGFSLVAHRRAARSACCRVLPGFLVTDAACSPARAFRHSSRAFTITRGSLASRWRSLVLSCVCDDQLAP